MLENIKDVVIYTRYGEFDFSIKEQISVLKEYCELNGLNIIYIYQDQGYSETNYNRPDFQKMIKDIAYGDVDAVIVIALQTLCSDDTIENLDNYFFKHNVKIVSYLEGVLTNQDDVANLVAEKKIHQEAMDIVMREERAKLKPLGAIIDPIDEGAEIIKRYCAVIKALKK